MVDKFHEECGVVGVYGHEEASTLAYLSLYALQHRGQESAGIVASNGDALIAHRGMGLVADIFNQDILSRLEGSLARVLRSTRRLARRLSDRVGRPRRGATRCPLPAGVLPAEAPVRALAGGRVVARGRSCVSRSSERVIGLYGCPRSLRIDIEKRCGSHFFR